jgi:mono/diheme cytochrome c family protein
MVETIFLSLDFMKMKKISVLLVLAITFIACSKKTVATKDLGTTGTTEAVQPEISSSAVEAPDANLLAAGKTIYEARCTRCHGMKPLDVYTPERWDGILKIMVPKAKLTESETQQVTAYVKANVKK